MACDSLHTYAGRAFSFKTKIYRSSYALFGAAGQGDSRELDNMLAACQTPASLPTPQELLDLNVDMDALIVFRIGGIFHVSAGKKIMTCWVDNIEDMDGAAVGSGAPFAIAAMACGQSAELAVMTACKFDPNSCLPIHSLELNPPPEGVQTC